ncbi:hypothetical protein [Streptomyces niveus]|uniref:hypothetical protein n=1 Tax=Streptomyces niveus TaxID=193462 RepID=UPI0009904CC7|nr:hypothetical protein [Streptomyces niveus]
MSTYIRNGLIKVNPARVTGRQKLYKQAEDELLDPRPGWPASRCMPCAASPATDRSPEKIKGRFRIPPKPALICGCLQSGRQDLNLRPLDSQG